MSIRRRALPAGWYPATASGIQTSVREFCVSGPEPLAGSVAGIVPHAGWAFSGSLACSVIRSIKPQIDTLVIVGGHLGPGDGVRAVFEDGFETPLGVIDADHELLGEIVSSLAVEDDRTVADNTVEVQLPLVRSLHPEVALVAFRAPPSGLATRLGETVYTAARTLGRRVAVIGSTDLTHYGPSYGFLPKGQGENAIHWVRETNDRRFIDAVLAMDGQQAVELALKERSACSSGGAAAALAFASRAGSTRGALLEYRTSLTVLPDSSSFVGYGAIVFPAP